MTLLFNLRFVFQYILKDFYGSKLFAGFGSESVKRNRIRKKPDPDPQLSFLGPVFTGVNEKQKA